MTSKAFHAIGNEPSEWVKRWSHLVPAGGEVLDVACGQGRHMRWFRQRNHPVTGVDRDASSLCMAASWGVTRKADLENEPWPFLSDTELDAQGNALPRQFAAVVVTNYLWRQLIPTLLASVAPGGILIYETFAEGNQLLGKPSRPDFLLQPGELLRACETANGIQVVAYESGYLNAPERNLQRVTALRAGKVANSQQSNGLTPLIPLLPTDTL